VALWTCRMRDVPARLMNDAADYINGTVSAAAAAAAAACRASTQQDEHIDMATLLIGDIDVTFPHSTGLRRAG